MFTRLKWSPAFLSALCLVSLAGGSATGQHLRKQLQPSPGNDPGFTLIDNYQAGLFWTNSLPTEKYSERQNLMNGAGVALGDFDNDGLCDFYLCNKFGPGALYRNLGDWKFEDVAARAGVECQSQISNGAVFADYNGDGRLDLFVTSFLGRNACFLNLGNGIFTNVTQMAGLKSPGGSTSQALADFDGDGDLDYYVTYFGIEAILRDGAAFSTRTVGGQPVVTGRFAKRLKVIGGRLVEFGEPDVFYVNDAGTFAPLAWDKTFFDTFGKPVPPQHDFGLAVQFRDINLDGLPDIYICNDFQTPDRIWINQGNGRFRAPPVFCTRNMSYASMGVDFADIDRDGHLDFFTVEMLSRDFRRHLRQTSPKDPEVRQPGQIDVAEDVARNALYWNRGDGTYAEIAWFAGVAASDWSWTPVFIDVDLDGFEDLLVSNGHLHDVNDRDTTIRRAGINRQNSAAQKKMLLDYPRLDTPNVVYRNRRDLTFEQMSEEWGFNSRLITHGMALADLDNDGDHDIVANCANAGPLIYRNNAQAPRITVRLKGQPPNTQGIGARVSLVSPDLTQTQEIICGGRYLSGDDPIRVFAAGGEGPFEIRVSWRNGGQTIIKDAIPNSLYVIEEDQKVSPPGSNQTPRSPEKTLFEDMSALLSHTHFESAYEDFQRQPLLPKKLSQLGPGVAWIDWNDDGADDLVIGTGRGGTLALFLNDGKGKLTKSELTSAKTPDDTAGLLALTMQGKPVLVAALARHEQNQPKGQLAWLLEHGAPPKPVAEGSHSSGPLASADVDGDGDLDLFIGGRFVPGRYPMAASSQLFLMENGAFQSDTRNLFNEVGLVAAALFTDLDADGFPELVLACEWGPIRVFRNNKGIFKEITSELGLGNSTGLWNSITSADFNGDGRLDLVAGNIGKNTFYNRSPDGPWLMYYGDFAGNGEVSMLEAFYNPDTKMIQPWRDWKLVNGTMSWVAGTFASNESYSSASAEQILGAYLPKARELKATTLHSTIFWNRGGTFEAEPLPPQAQWAPAFGLVSADFNADGSDDLFIAQNFFASRPDDDRLDAGRGLLLLGSPQGRLSPVPGQESGLLIYGEQRGAAASDFDADGRMDLVVTQNGAETKLFRNVLGKPGVRIRLKGPSGNPHAIGATLRWKNSGPLREVRAGNGYWSQDSSTLVFARNSDTDELAITWPGGQKTQAEVPVNANEVVIEQNGEVKIVR